MSGEESDPFTGSKSSWNFGKKISCSSQDMAEPVTLTPIKFRKFSCTSWNDSNFFPLLLHQREFVRFSEEGIFQFNHMDSSG